MRKNSTVLKIDLDLFEYVWNNVEEGSPPVGVYLAPESRFTIRPSGYHLARQLDKNNDLVLSEDELSVESGTEQLLIDTLSGKNPPNAWEAAKSRSSSAISTPKTKEPGSKLEESLKQAQFTALLDRDLKGARTLAGGEQVLRERNLLSDASVGLAYLVDTASRELGIDQQAAREKLTDTDLPLGKAYQALSTALAVSAAGSFFPPAPLISQLKERVGSLRQDIKYDATAVGHMTSVNILLKLAKPEEP